MLQQIGCASSDSFLSGEERERKHTKGFFHSGQVTEISNNTDTVHISAMRLQKMFSHRHRKGKILKPYQNVMYYILPSACT